MSRRRSTVLLALGCATVVVVGSAPVAPSGPPVAVLKGAQAVASKCPGSGGAKIAEASAPNGAVQVFGHGWGHGMGMSQYGAQGAARLGCDYRSILGTYYRDSSVVTRTLDASVVLKLAGATSGSTLAAENGAVTWLTGSRTVVQPKGSTWSVARRTVNGQAGLALLDAAGARKLFVPNAGLLSARHAGVVVTVRAGSTRLRTKWDTARFIG